MIVGVDTRHIKKSKIYTHKEYGHFRFGITKRYNVSFPQDGSKSTSELPNVLGRCILEAEPESWI